MSASPHRRRCRRSPHPPSHSDQGTRPRRPAPRQPGVGEASCSSPRTHPLQPPDRRVDRVRVPGSGASSALQAGAHRAVGVQRPFGIAFTGRPAVHLELTHRCPQRMHRQLHLTGTLLGQNDRLKKTSFTRAGAPTAANAMAAYTGAPGTTTPGAVDDMVGEPAATGRWTAYRCRRYRLEARSLHYRGLRIPQAVHLVDVRRSKPEGESWNRIGGAVPWAAWSLMQRSELGLRPSIQDRGQRVGDLAPAHRHLGSETTAARPVPGQTCTAAPCQYRL